MASKVPDGKRTGKSAEVAGGPGSAIEPPVLSKIVEIMERSGVTSLDWRRGDERLILRRGVEVAAHPVAHAPLTAHAPVASAPVTHPAPAPATAPTAAPKKEASGQVVTSPLVGTFYRAPAADAPPFVEEGQVVRKGQVLCIVEAMKLMNEIESEVAGKVVEVIAQNGQTVEFGQALFRIEPS
jgi:acetyl-CoA carboxylase biotin carboxyl carrier protein